MTTIRPDLAGLVTILIFLCIVGSAAGGVYTRYLLRYSQAIRSDIHDYALLALLLVSIGLVCCFAAYQEMILTCAGVCLASFVMAYGIWDANPSWDEPGLRWSKNIDLTKRD